MIHRDRFRSVNASRLKQLRLARNWSQEELARRAGYSDRLIRKAESGGSLSTETILDLAAALSTSEQLVTPDSLERDMHGMAYQVLEAYDRLGREMLSEISQLLSPDLIWYCPGDPAIAPFAGTWRGHDGLQQWLDIFFGIFKRNPSSLSPRWSTSESVISARYEDQLWIGEHALPPFWVNLHFHIRNNLIVRIDDEYDTKAAHDAHAIIEKMTKDRMHNESQ